MGDSTQAADESEHSTDDGTTDDSTEQPSVDEATEIEGTTTENTTGPYGERGCGETMHVVFDGQDVFVPFNGVRASGYDYYGEVPDELDVDRIINYDGHVHAEADVEGGVVEIVPDYNSATAEFRGYDRWELHKFDGETGQAGSVIYERDDESGD